jgi:acyl dehydratase
MPLNRTLIGKIYPPVMSHVTAEAVQEYARACNDDNPSYFQPPAATGIIAPPVFNAVITWLALITAISDPELRVDLLRLLHRGQDMRFYEPVRPDDLISARACISSIEDSAAGETLTIGLDASNQRNQVVSRTIFTTLIRGRRQRDSAPTSSFTGHQSPPNKPLVTIARTIDLDQTVRYANASGDRNPIHLDDSVARMAGLPGIIVHGLCTMAFASQVIVDHVCGGDPARLSRLAVQFSHPVFPGDTITTTVWPEKNMRGARCFSYETRNAAGVVVLRDGIAEINREGS